MRSRTGHEPASAAQMSSIGLAGLIPLSRGKATHHVEFSAIPRSGVDAWRGRSTRSTSSSSRSPAFFTALICILIVTFAARYRQKVERRSLEPTDSRAS